METLKANYIKAQSNLKFIKSRSVERFIPTFANINLSINSNFNEQQNSEKALWEEFRERYWQNIGSA